MQEAAAKGLGEAGASEEGAARNAPTAEQQKHASPADASAPSQAGGLAQRFKYLQALAENSLREIAQLRSWSKMPASHRQHYGCA